MPSSGNPDASHFASLALAGFRLPGFVGVRTDEGLRVKGVILAGREGDGIGVEGSCYPRCARGLADPLPFAGKAE
jgi:hypothetical protein